jgi:hypothetical protein
MADVTADGAEGRDAATRLQHLRESVQRVRTRATTAGQNERLVFLVGGALIPFGLLVVLIGWYGASHTPYLFEQVPYLISGGLLGIALVLAGGFLYFGYWMARLMVDQREQSAQVVAALERIEEQLAAAAATAPSGRAARAAAVAAPTDLVATATGNMVHRPDCTVVAGKSGVKRVKAGADGFVPCKLCQPDFA